ncbi:GGDEF domain-containing protein [Mycolicibacterium sp. Y3]
MVLSSSDSCAGPSIPFDDPRGSALSNMIARWWRTPVDYGTQVAFFATRGLLWANQLLFGAGLAMVAVIATIMQFSPAGPGTPTARLLAGAVAFGALGWALRWWLGGWPTRSTSRVFIASVDAAIVLVMLINTNTSVVGFGPTVLVLLSFYLVFYEDAKVLLLHSVWITIVVLLLALNTVHDTGGDIALGAVKLIVGASLAFAPLAIQLGIWILQNEANESLRDPLTGLLNRRGVRLYVRNLLAGRAFGADHVVVILADLDRFKDINDAHGHGVGDEVLIRTARRIAAAVGAHSVVARVGGEEFIIIAVVPPNGCAGAAERVCAALCSPDDSIPVTASIGATSVPIATLCSDTANAAQMWESLLDRADQAMFEAKRIGGNQSIYVPTAGGR